MKVTLNEDNEFFGGFKLRRKSLAIRGKNGKFKWPLISSAISLGLDAAELWKINSDRFALPLGCALFAYLLALRVWSLRDPLPLASTASLDESMTQI